MNFIAFVLLIGPLIFHFLYPPVAVVCMQEWGYITIWGKCSLYNSLAPNICTLTCLHESLTRTMMVSSHAFCQIIIIPGSIIAANIYM